MIQVLLEEIITGTDLTWFQSLFTFITYKINNTQFNKRSGHQGNTHSRVFLTLLSQVVTK